ncbi:hypothetical protein IVB22_08990, partial [Bradyrhizobium sp. 190]|nr:hypothetical protein [Bradyrhizobium sp. 190]
MIEVEKRELFEQERKIFEAAVQRADKRSGSFNFLTWSFFIAPLTACDEFLVGIFKSAAAEQEVVKTAQAGAAPQEANDHLPAIDPSKTGAEDETAKRPVASSEARATQFDPTGLLAQPHDDALKPSAARSEAVAAEGTAMMPSPAMMMPNPAILTLTPHSKIVPSTRYQRIPTPEALKCRVGQSANPLSPTCYSFSPSMIGFVPLLGAVGGLSNDVVGGIMPVEAQPVLATETNTNTVSTLTHDVGATIAPVAAAVQPMLATVTDSVGTLSHDVDGTVAPVEAAAQPVLATVADSAATLTDDVGATIAPVAAAAQPVLATVADSAATLTDDVGATIAPVAAAAQPVLATVTDSAATLTDDVGATIAPVAAAAQ